MNDETRNYTRSEIVNGTGFAPNARFRLLSGSNDTERYTIETAVYRDGESQGVVTLGHRDGMWEAHTLANNYIATLLVQGGTATYSPEHDEYRVAMPNGTVEYVRVKRVTA